MNITQKIEDRENDWVIQLTLSSLILLPIVSWSIQKVIKRRLNASSLCLFNKGLIKHLKMIY
ncbi:MAG TPA: hypothetical protein PK079_02780 [Leptospiraceae bacterium]|nr:hypothetical protein [Leptospiraceae bacterium]HMW04485.1 hypothetical protein [Leptospiraceae bacterium]HMX31143.1 hypothetical protein [Leptospiraceae bacterium]HMY30671.1 hypothetical protein [Leptospiraceae bacterium]HMZ63260.1 hypothetical protein [Leptospiraceae bacterium]